MHKSDSSKGTKELPQTIAGRTLNEIQDIEKNWPLIRKALWSLVRKHWFLSGCIVLVFVTPSLYSLWDNIWGLRPTNAALEKQVQDLQRDLQNAKQDVQAAKQDSAPFKTAAI